MGPWAGQRVAQLAAMVNLDLSDMGVLVDGTLIPLPFPVFRIRLLRSRGSFCGTNLGLTPLGSGAGASWLLLKCLPLPVVGAFARPAKYG